MELFIEGLFRFICYLFFGIAMETIFAVHGIEVTLATKIPRRVPKKYLEGFISVYMFPLHGFGLLFGFEFVHSLIGDWFILFRFLIWAVLITGMEVLWGVLCRKVLGFYSWDYYKQSRFKMFKEGYTTWTLVPLWGITGLFLEHYSSLVIYLSQYVPPYFGQ